MNRVYKLHYQNPRDLERNLYDGLRYMTREQHKVQILDKVKVDWTTNTVTFEAEQQLISNRVLTCECGGEYYFNTYCGAYVCEKCKDHQGLGRCFCGWSKGGSLHDDVFPHGSPDQILEAWG